MRFNYKETYYYGDFGGTDVTHETAIGSIDRKQMETLMARDWKRMRRWILLQEAS